MNNVVYKDFYCANCGTRLKDVIFLNGELICPKCKKSNGIVLIGSGGGVGEQCGGAGGRN